MTKYAKMAASAFILMVGGCQFNGTIDGSKLLADVEKIAIVKKPATNDLQTADGGVQRINQNYSGYSVGTHPGELTSEDDLLLGGLRQRDKKLTIYKHEKGTESSILLDTVYFAAVGPALSGLPSGTMTYGGKVHTYPSNNYFKLTNKEVRQFGAAEIVVDFDASKITQFDLRYQHTNGLGINLHTKIVELRGSNEITIDPVTGTFRGTSTYFNPFVGRSFYSSATSWEDSPEDLSVNGHFHGTAELSGISGVIYNEDTKGAFIAACTTCEQESNE